MGGDSIGKKYVENLRKQVDASTKSYDFALQFKDVMQDDLLNMADDVIINQKRLILALQDELRIMDKDDIITKFSVEEIKSLLANETEMFLRMKKNDVAYGLTHAVITLQKYIDNKVIVLERKYDCEEKNTNERVRV